MGYYYPTFWLDITVPILGSASAKKAQANDDSVQQWTMPVHRFRWERNDYSMADVLEVEADWSVAGIDPRMLIDATGEFSLRDGAPPARQTWGSPQAPSDLRFAGIMQKPKRKWDPNARTVSLVFHDYTTLFIAERPFVSAGIPDYSQSLSQAWARICDHVGPTDPDNGNKTISVIGSNLRNNIEFQGGAKDVQLGDSVGARFRKDRIGASGPSDAWAIWQQCVQMCGLISYIETDHLVITTATDFYTERTPPRLIMGQNILELEEERDLPRSRSGIILRSFDPMTGSMIEAFSPPLGDSSVRKKHLSTKKKKTEDQVVKGESREVFFYPGITNPARLQAKADQIQAERSIQELAGRVVTTEMTVEAVADGADAGAAGPGAASSLLDIHAGDVCSIEVEQDLLNTILNMNAAHTTGGSADGRIYWLVEHGYNEDLARVLVANLAYFGKLGTKFFVKSVIVECDANANPPSFRIEIHYVNRIQLTGDANGQDE